MQTKLALQDAVYSSRRARETPRPPLATSAADIHVPRTCLVIPSLNDQNPCAQFRSPIDMMRQGWSVSLFQAAQQ